MTDLGGGDQGEDALDHAQARPQDGDDGQLLAGQLVGHGLCHRGLDLHRLQRKVPGGVVAHEGGDLAHDLPEVSHAGGLIPQDGQLMLQQGVVQYVYHFHLYRSPFSQSVLGGLFFCGFFPFQALPLGLGEAVVDRHQLAGGDGLAGPSQF